MKRRRYVQQYYDLTFFEISLNLSKNADLVQSNMKLDAGVMAAITKGRPRFW
jgi:hypothetical protein